MSGALPTTRVDGSRRSRARRAVLAGAAAVVALPFATDAAHAENAPEMTPPRP